MIRQENIWMLYLGLLLANLYFDGFSQTLGLLIPLLALADFLRCLGSKIPIRELILTTLGLQTLLVPYLYYGGYIPESEIYPMAVKPDIYFNYMTPAFLMLAIGISIGKEGNYQFKIVNPARYYKIGTILIVVGIIADFVFFVTPGFLAFFVKLITYMKFIGAYYVLFSDHKNAKWWIVLSFVNVTIITIYQTVFQELLGWGMFFLLYFFYKSKISKKVQTALVLTLLIGVFILQNAKVSYRNNEELVNESSQLGDNVTNFVSVYAESSTSSETFSEESIGTNFVRFNQGYIISRILYHMPNYEPFANGETVEDAILGAIVPRFLNPNKTTVGGGNGLYSRFTGYILVGSTSMDLSVFGELYANYGRDGGIFASLLLGLFYGLVIRIIIRQSRFDLHLLFWLPYLCLIMVRPENGFTPIMNHIFKATMVLFAFNHIYLKFASLKGKIRLIYT